MPASTEVIRSLLPMALLGVLLGAAAACRASSDAPVDRDPSNAPAAAPAPVSATDAAGRVVRLEAPAQRVASLVPQAERILGMLGLEHWHLPNPAEARAPALLVGSVTRQERAELERLLTRPGGAEQALRTILSARPDLLLMRTADTAWSMVPQLVAEGVVVFMIQARDTADLFGNLERLGRLVGRNAAGQRIADSLRAELAGIRASAEGLPTPSVHYVGCEDPERTVGQESLLAQMIGIAGGQLAFPELEGEWSRVREQELFRRDPDVLVYSSDCPSASVLALLNSPEWRRLTAVRSGGVIDLADDLLDPVGPNAVDLAQVLREKIHRSRRPRT